MSEAVELAILLSAKDAASEVLGHVGEKFHGLGGAAQVAMVGIGAAAAAATAIGGTLFGMAEGAESAAMEVRKLARETGLSAEEASKLRYAGERLNIDTDALSKSLGIFSKSLESAHPKLAQYGIDVVKTADGHVDMAGTLDKIADKFKSMPDGVEKTATAMNLFGKSGKDMIPLLNQGSEGLKEMGLDATKMGLVFSKDGVDSAFKFGQAQKDLSEQFEGVRNKVGMAVMPAITELFKLLAKFASEVLPKVVSAIKPVMDILGELFDVLTGRAPDAGAALTKAIGPDAAKIVMGAFAAIRDTVKDVFEKVNAAIGFLKEHWDFFGPAFAAIAVTVIVPAMAAWTAAAIAAAAATIVAMLPVVIPLAAIGVAVGLLSLAWSSNWGDIQGKAQAVVTTLQDLFAGFRDLMAGVWNAIQTAVAGAINNIIGVLNIFIGGYDAIAEKLGLPLIGKIQLITPNLLDVNAALNDLTRTRYATVFLQEITSHTASEHAYPQAAGGDYMVTKPTLFLAGEAGPERATFTPRGGSGFGGGGGGVTVNVYADVIDSQAVDRLADKIGASFTQSRRMQGLA